MLFLMVFSMVLWEASCVRTVDLSTACAKSNGAVDIVLSPFSMSAVIFRYGSRSVPLPPAFVHKMPSSWPLTDDRDDSDESGEHKSGYIFENHDRDIPQNNTLRNTSTTNFHESLTSLESKRRRRRGLFSFPKSGTRTCIFRLSYDEREISGMYFGMEDISLDTERSCNEFIEISGTNVNYETTDRKICGKDLSSLSAKLDAFEEIFIGNLTITVSINPAEGNSMFRFVVTGFHTGETCNAKSLFSCPTSSYRPEYESLKNEPLCIWGGFLCDTHLNCPFGANDEKGQKCPKTNLLKQKQSLYLQSRQDDDMANLSRLVLGISIFFVCIMCVISCQFIAAKRKRLNAEPNDPSNLVTVAVTSSSGSMSAPPPSYSDVMCPPPAYDTIVGVDNLFIPEIRKNVIEVSQENVGDKEESSPASASGSSSEDGQIR